MEKTHIVILIVITIFAALTLKFAHEEAIKNYQKECAKKGSFYASQCQ